MRTHEWAPRVLIANSNLVPQWATWEEFRRLESLGLTMYGQMTAGSWIYIGTQGILQGTYETFAAVAAKRFGGSLAGTITLTAGLGGMGGAQPLAVTMNGGVAIVHRLRPVPDRPPDRARLPGRGRGRHRRRAAPGDRGPGRRAAAVHRPARQRGRDRARDAGRGRADRRRHRPDLGARPADLPAPRRAVRGHGRAARRGPGRLHRAGPEVDGRARRGDGRLHGRGRRGLRLRQLDPRRGGSWPVTSGRSPSPASCPPTSGRCSARARGPFRWAALSGDPADIAATDAAILDLFPDNEPLARWIRMAEEKVHFQGLPARICWLGYGERHLAGPAVQRAGRPGGGAAPRSCSAGTTSTAARWPRPTGRPRQWPTARTRSPTGRC